MQMGRHGAENAGTQARATPPAMTHDSPLRMTHSLPHPKACPQRCIKSELGQEGLQARGGAAFFLAGVARNDEFVFQAVLSADEFGQSDVVAAGLEAQPA